MAVSPWITVTTTCSYPLSGVIISQLALFSLLADPLVLNAIHVSKLDAMQSTHDESVKNFIVCRHFADNL